MIAIIVQCTFRKLGGGGVRLGSMGLPPPSLHIINLLHKQSFYRCVNFVIFLCFVIFFFSLQQARAEQEEEFISNTLLKKIHSLKKEKEALAVNYEQEEEFLTNDLSRKLAQVSNSCCGGGGDGGGGGGSRVEGDGWWHVWVKFCLLGLSCMLEMMSA